jgi:hypothetical protein
VTRGEKVRNESRADVTGGASDEETHGNMMSDADSTIQQ